MNQKLCGPVIHDDGVPLVKQKFLCTCHHVTRMDVVEQKILVDLSSRDDGVRLGNKKFLCTCHHGCRGTKQSCGSAVIT